jgi:hypothetical protein
MYEQYSRNPYLELESVRHLIGVQTLVPNPTPICLTSQRCLSYFMYEQYSRKPYLELESVRHLIGVQILVLNPTPTCLSSQRCLSYFMYGQYSRKPYLELESVRHLIGVQTLVLKRKKPKQQLPSSFWLSKLYTLLNKESLILTL